MDIITVETKVIKDQLLERFNVTNIKSEVGFFGMEYEIDIPCALCQMYLKLGRMHGCKECPLYKYEEDEPKDGNLDTIEGCLMYFKENILLTDEELNTIASNCNVVAISWPERKNEFMTWFVSQARKLISKWKVKGE